MEINIFVTLWWLRISGFDQNQKHDKIPFIIFAGLEFLIEKIHGSKHILQSSFKAKVSEHIPSGFSVSTMSSFKSIENKHDVYRDKNCKKKVL